ncbi:MAG: c-type cytochrome domain-containing protein [Anaerolineales bacterium]
MRKYLLMLPTLLVFVVSACGAQTPQATLIPATATDTAVPPTQTPLPTDTLAPAPTDTAIPPTEAVATDTATTGGVSFANDVMPIFVASCNKCHGVEQVKEGLDMTTYDTLMAGSFNGLVITPGNAADSYLVQQIVEGEMPKRGPGLSEEQIKIITDWVNQGALNN